MASNSIVPCIKLKDSNAFSLPASKLFPTGDPRSALATELRLARQMLDQNRRNFEAFGITAVCGDKSDGSGAAITFVTHDVVGAFPLKSPTSGRWDFGVVIEPRQGWRGFGGMLSTMGWKVVPELQRLPPLPLSAREIPSWVMGSVILGRIENLLRDMARKFESRHDILMSPRGRIDWQEYIAHNITMMRMLDIPCDYSELSDNRVLMGVIHYTIRKIYNELNNLGDGGVIVANLIMRAQELLHRVSAYAQVKPAPQMLEPWFYGKKMPTEKFSDGLEAMQWSSENRGLAGLSDLRGLPWKMSISAFFEAFVETVVRRALLYVGGNVRVGRNNETVIPISWERACHGTQSSLRPDFVIERGDEIIIVDAKFKSYWYDMTYHRWQNTDITTQEEHRADLLQVLAYSTCFSSEHLTVCLVYPCDDNLYESLSRGGCLDRRANVYSGTRKINVVLTAIPMRGRIEDVARRFAVSVSTNTRDQN